MRAGESETLGYAVEALVLAKNWNAAAMELEQALAIAEARAEGVYLPQLFCSKRQWHARRVMLPTASARSDAPSTKRAHKKRRGMNWWL
jgi:hypothetical protein